MIDLRIVCIEVFGSLSLFHRRSGLCCEWNFTADTPFVFMLNVSLELAFQWQFCLVFQLFKSPRTRWLIPCCLLPSYSNMEAVSPWRSPNIKSCQQSTGQTFKTLVYVSKCKLGGTSGTIWYGEMQFVTKVGGWRIKYETRCSWIRWRCNEGMTCFQPSLVDIFVGV